MTRMTSILAVAGFALLAATGAQAALVGVSPNVDLSDGPYSISFGDGAATYTFADDGATGGFFGARIASVRTDGTAKVLFDPAIFGGDVSIFFTDDMRRATINGRQLGSFDPSPDFAPIDAEVTRYIGLSFDQGADTFYGFARLSQRFLFDVAYNDEPGAGAFVTSGPYAALPAPAPVPLPATAPLLAFAAAGFAALRRRRRAA